MTVKDLILQNPTVFVSLNYLYNSSNGRVTLLMFYLKLADLLGFTREI